MIKINRNINGDLSHNETTNEFNLRKEYKTPELVNYGDISELVLALAGLGPDGFPIPPLTFS